MKKRLSIYMPRWMRWFVIAILAPIWGLLAYTTFFAPRAAEAVAPAAFWIVTLVLLLVAVMVWLAAGRLPIYFAEIEEKES